MKKNRLFIGAVLFAAFLAGCKTPPAKDQNPPEPVKVSKEYQVSRAENYMFWEVGRTDTDAKVYVLGTFHYGDDRLKKLSEDITSKFVCADRFASELGTYDEAVFQKEYEKVMQESVITDDSKNIIDNLSNEELMILLGNFSVEELASKAYYNPWVLSDALIEKLYHNSGLSFQKGYDNTLTDMAVNMLKKKIDPLDDLYEHLALMNYGSWNFQMEQFKETLNKYNDIENTLAEMNVLYEAYLYCDEPTIVELSGLTEKPKTEEERIYIDILNNKRNKDWAQKISDYLDKGGTTFIFAGVGHFVGSESVFEYLKQIPIK